MLNSHGVVALPRATVRILLPPSLRLSINRTPFPPISLSEVVFPHILIEMCVRGSPRCSNVMISISRGGTCIAKEMKRQCHKGYLVLRDMGMLKPL